MSEPIATRLESYRTAHGLTQRQMADRLGVSWRTYRGWVNGRTPGVALGLLERLLDEWEGRIVRRPAAQDTDGRECADCGAPAYPGISRCLECARQYGVKLGGTG